MLLGSPHQPQASPDTIIIWNPCSIQMHQMGSKICVEWIRKNSSKLWTQCGWISTWV